MHSDALVLIIGAGRSGTSALTRTLSLCGCSLPPAVLGAHETNPKGFWEPIDVVNLNIEFLSQHESLQDPTMFPEDTVVAPDDSETFIGKIQQFLRECPRGTPLVVKDPRITLLLDYWVEAAHRQQLSPRIVIAVRHPEEVVASVRKAMSSPRSQHQSFESVTNTWLKWSLTAERGTRNLTRVFVEYANLLKDWRTEVRRISSALSIGLRTDNVAVDSFLNGDLRRQRQMGEITDVFAYSWTDRAYRTLSAAAQDVPIDSAQLDEIHDAYRMNARAFRTILDGWRNAPRSTMADPIAELPTWKAGAEFQNPLPEAR